MVQFSLLLMFSEVAKKPPVYQVKIMPYDLFCQKVNWLLLLPLLDFPPPPLPCLKYCTLKIWLVVRKFSTKVLECLVSFPLKENMGFQRSERVDVKSKQLFNKYVCVQVLGTVPLGTLVLSNSSS